MGMKTFCDRCDKEVCYGKYALLGGVKDLMDETPVKDIYVFGRTVHLCTKCYRELSKIVQNWWDE